jgi:hypothetical protein
MTRRRCPSRGLVAARARWRGCCCCYCAHQDHSHQPNAVDGQPTGAGLTEERGRERRCRRVLRDQLKLRNLGQDAVQIAWEVVVPRDLGQQVRGDCGRGGTCCSADRAHGGALWQGAGPLTGHALVAKIGQQVAQRVEGVQRGERGGEVAGHHALRRGGGSGP